MEKKIGRGGMADVYVGRHTTLNRPMAVKILHPHMTVNAELRRRFRDEAQAVAALRHPNIVQVIDFDVIDDRPYIVMELLEGMSFAEYLRGLHGMGQSLPLDTIVRLTGEVSSALDYAHKRGIVHRDVKPANIILRAGSIPINPQLPLAPDVEPVLTDFGVARIASSTTPTVSGTILGTPAYMSPEQVRGEPVDNRSDIYSLGIILYEVLAGRLPFDPETDTPASILYKHVHENPPQLPNISLAIQAVLKKSLMKDRDQRYQRAGQMAADLQASVKAIPSAAATEALATQLSQSSPAPSAATPPKRSRLPTFAIFAALSVAAVMLVGGAVLGNRLLGGGVETEPTAAGQESEVLAPPASSEPAGSDLGNPPTPTGLPAGAVSAGFAIVRDSGLEMRLTQVEAPPDGASYHAWLLGAEGTPPLHLNLDGDVEWLAGELLVSFFDPEGASLLAEYGTLVISLETEGSVLSEPSSSVYLGSVSPEIGGFLRLASEVRTDRRVPTDLADLFSRQAGHFLSHAGLALGAMGADNLTDTKTHGEHSLNIIEGEAGEFYDDWNGNGRPENPGDDVGLLPYVRLLEAAGTGTAIAEEQRGGSGDPGRAIAEQATEIANRLAEAREILRQIVQVDTTADIHSFGLDTELAALLSVKALIDQTAAQAAGQQLAFAIELFPAP
ncbi:MAG: protein kinase domain-containing protein [Anaerolineales bacterium]